MEISALRMGGLPYESAMRHDGRFTRNTAVAAPGDVSNRVDGSAGKLSSGSGRRQLIRKTACVGARYVGRKCEKTLCQIVVTLCAVTTICAAPPGGHACRGFNARKIGQINSKGLLMGVINVCLARHGHATGGRFPTAPPPPAATIFSDVDRRGLPPARGNGLAG